jgi:hypothetical protein
MKMHFVFLHSVRPKLNVAVSILSSNYVLSLCQSYVLRINRRRVRHIEGIEGYPEVIEWLVGEIQLSNISEGERPSSQIFVCLFSCNIL